MIDKDSHDDIWSTINIQKKEIAELKRRVQELEKNIKNSVKSH
jgi:cell division protein FtsB